MRTLLVSLMLLSVPAAAVAQDTLAQDVAEPPLTAAQKIELLWAERDIQRALIEYGRAVDEGDFDAYVGLFAQNGAWVGGLGIFEGREAIRGMLEANMRPGPRERLTSFHLMSNPLIEIADSGMTATSVSRWTFFLPGEDGAPRPAMSGRYFDAWVKVGEEWLIARREAPADIPFDDLSGVLSAAGE